MPVFGMIAAGFACWKTETLGPFMLAEFYERDAAITSRTILLSTLGSLISLSILVGTFVMEAQLRLAEAFSLPVPHPRIRRQEDKKVS